jgi:hypothetical protein
MPYKKASHDEFPTKESVNHKHLFHDVEETRRYWRKVNNSKPKAHK